MLIALIVADVLMAAAFGLAFTRIPPQIPLFYTSPWGEDRLADFWLIGLIPFFMHVIFFFNNWLVKRFFRSDSFLAKLFHTTNWAVIIVSTFLFIRILIIVAL